MSHGGAHLNTNCSKSLILEGGIHVNQLKAFTWTQTAARAGCGLPLHHSSPSSHKHAQLHAPAQPGPRGAMPMACQQCQGTAGAGTAAPVPDRSWELLGAAAPSPRNAGSPCRLSPAPRSVRPSHHTAAVTWAPGGWLTLCDGCLGHALHLTAMTSTPRGLAGMCHVPLLPLLTPGLSSQHSHGHAWKTWICVHCLGETWTL